MANVVEVREAPKGSCGSCARRRGPQWQVLVNGKVVHQRAASKEAAEKIADRFRDKDKV